MAASRQHRAVILGSIRRPTRDPRPGMVWCVPDYNRPWRRRFWQGFDITWAKNDPRRLSSGRGVFVGQFYTVAAMRWWAPQDRASARRILKLIERDELARRWRTYGPGLGEPTA